MFNLIVKARAMKNILSPSRSERFSLVGDLIALNVSIQCSSRNLNVIFMQKKNQNKQANKKTVPCPPPFHFSQNIFKCLSLWFGICRFHPKHLSDLLFFHLFLLWSSPPALWQPCGLGHCCHHSASADENMNHLFLQGFLIVSSVSSHF